MKFLITLAVCICVISNLKSIDAVTSCFNGGVLAEGECRCSPGFIGDQCQYSPDPCQQPDPVSCGNVNCYQSDLATFFSCQTKCLCCKNKQCYNGGKVKSDCTCECFTVSAGTPSKFDAADDCQSVLSGQCTDDNRCSAQFGVFGSNTDNCRYEFVRSACPKTCGVC